MIYVKSKTEAAAKRVLDAFGDKLPKARLLCFFDDEDWQPFKSGKTTRGLYSPVQHELLESAPEYVRQKLVTTGTAGLSVNAFDHFIYLHGSTCSDLRALTMTFAHELQHFLQYMNTPILWAPGSLIPQLNKETLNALGWKDWADIPHEREARIVAKQVSADILGVDAVRDYIAERITTAVDALDKRDWEFISGIRLSDSYDLAGATKSAFRRLLPYRAELEQLLLEASDNPTFPHIDLDSLTDV